MALTTEQCDKLMGMTRQEMIHLLCDNPYITALPQDQQGEYVFGTTKNGRAVCLAWRDRLDGCIDSNILVSAYREIGRAGLKVPFLFFGLSCLYGEDRRLFQFGQIPWFFGEHANPVLRALRTLNLQGNLRVPIVREEKEPGDEECEEAIILLEEPDPDLKVGYILLSTRREQTTFCEQDFDEGEDANRSYREVLAPEALSYGLLCCTCNRLLVALRTRTSSERS